MKDPAYLCLVWRRLRKFHLRTLLISDKCSLEKYRPSQDDLRKAEECLKQISLDMLPSEDNFYVV